MKYLKLFTNHSDYNSAKSELDKPNVSHCVNENEVHYNKKIVTKIRYNASAKLVETTNSNSNGLHTNAFIGENGQLNITSHTFENGIGTIIIDGSVITIGDYAFKGSTITTINIPDSVTSIGNFAFNSCTSLTSVTIPDSVTSIGGYAFYTCSNLTSVIIGDSVINVGNRVFSGCSKLQNAIIGNSMTNIPEKTFEYCNALTSVGGIGSGASIEIPNNIISISDYAFYLCTGLTNVVIPNSITSIGSSIFSTCTSLTSVTFNCNLSNIGSSNFSNCNNLTNLYFNCTNVPGLGALQSVTSVVFGDNVTTIPNMAFMNYTGLTNVIIGSNVGTIGSSTFYGCSNLTSITSSATTAPTIKNSTFRSVKTGGTLTVPTGSTGYDVWMDTSNYYLGYYNWTKVEQ